VGIREIQWSNPAGLLIANAVVTDVFEWITREGGCLIIINHQNSPGPHALPGDFTKRATCGNSKVVTKCNAR
jgi:hypothetical protein